MKNEAPAMTDTPQKKPKSKLVKIVLWMLATAILVALLFSLYVWNRLQGSLPVLDGEVPITHLAEPVSITRDGQGIPTIKANNYLDMLRALGFTHAQDRYFQMDGLRRFPSGELSELLGSLTINMDKRIRPHQLRKVAKAVFQNASPEHRQWMEAYTDGVNQGLALLKAPPFEYVLLKAKPEPWLPEDSILVIFAMALDLQEYRGTYEKTLGSLHATVPEALYQFLTPWGSEWDAPLIGPVIETPDIPGPDVIDLRKTSTSSQLRHQKEKAPNDLKPGSNNWAVNGALTPYQSGMIAGDMHLGLGIPHIWYRAQMIWDDPQKGQQTHVGATLPGTPSLVSGSNGHIAWAFTNSYMDWSDVILLEMDPQKPGHYLTPDGSLPIETVHYQLEIKGQPTEKQSFEKTIWGPILGENFQKQKYVVKWASHHPEATNFNLINLSMATSVMDALTVGKRCGMPGQNLVVVDTQGNVGWTIAGILPKRVGFDGRIPTSWADGQRYWDGWLAPEQYPQVLNPEDHRIWTANARVVDPSFLPIVGESGYAFGARAKQIRDRLFEKDVFTEKDMLAIQMDHEAIFLRHWQKLMESQLAKRTDENGQALHKLVKNWSGHASVDDVGYRVVKHFRADVIDHFHEALSAATKKADPNFDRDELPNGDSTVWKILTQRPDHMLPSKFDSWDDLLDQTIDGIIEFALKRSGALEDHTWGKLNTLQINHNFSSAIPIFGERLNMKAEPVPGDSYMPLVQSSDFGASQRMVIAPGHEDKALFHMPGGQSGHPLSPFYRAGHDDWVKGTPSPLLPGETQHELILKPKAP